MPNGCLAGNAVPTLTWNDWREAATFNAMLSSMTADSLLRNRVSTHLNLTYLARLVTPAGTGISAHLTNEIAGMVTRLSCTTPELADAWNEVFPGDPWTYTSAERDPWKRGLLRAELDAIVAELYGLSVAEYARVLTGFPLLDRDQPALLGDAFVTDATSDEPPGVEGIDWERSEWGVYEKKPRSFITRDLALLTYIRRRGEAPPQDLHRFYVEEVGLDPDGPLSRFRIGEQRDLIDRVELAKQRGAVAYVPSGRGGGSTDEAGDAEEGTDGEEG